MHSTELPVTEWWDPAEEVYSVPPCPQGDGRTDANLWTEAFLFSETIGWIWSDFDGYWGRWTRQLTTGAGRPCPALAWWGEPEPPAPPCTCRYGLFYVAGVVPSHALDPYANGWRRGVYAFRIDPYCEHHGDARRSGPYLIEGGGLYEYVLDEDERRGH